jgi:hypothetical protein
LFHTTKIKTLTAFATSCMGTASLKHVTEGKTDKWTEVKERRGKRCMQLLNGFKEKRECCKLKREAPNHTQRRTRFGRSYGPVVRQIT